MRITVDFDALWSRKLVRIGAAALIACAGAFPILSYASPTGPLVSFTPGTTIKAADFNANFQALKTASDDNDTRIGTLSGLSTTAKTNLVAAVNEVFTKAGTATQGPAGATGATGATGPQGPAGVFEILGAATFVNGTGGGTNAWTAGAGLSWVGNSPFPVSLVAGKPYSMTVRVLTSDANTGLPGNPLVGGNLVLDLEWVFLGGRAVGNINVPEVSPVVQNAVATVAIIGGTANDKTVTFTGNVPTPGNTPRGYPSTVLMGQSGFVGVLVNGASTAQGQSVTFASVTITP